MKLFTAIQGVAMLSSVGMSVQDHSVAVGIALFAGVQILYGVPSVTIFVMRRVKNYKRRVAGMESYRQQMFAQQYGKPRSTPTYRQQSSPMYTIK